MGPRGESPSSRRRSAIFSARARQLTPQAFREERGSPLVTLSNARGGVGGRLRRHAGDRGRRGQARVRLARPRAADEGTRRARPAGLPHAAGAAHDRRRRSSAPAPSARVRAVGAAQRAAASTAASACADAAALRARGRGLRAGAGAGAADAVPAAARRSGPATRRRSGPTALAIAPASAPAGGPGDHRGRQRDPRPAVQVRRRPREVGRHGLRLLGLRCPTRCTRAGLLKTALDSSGFMSWGEAGPGPVGHDLREPRPRLHGRRRPALRHQRHATTARAGTRDMRSAAGYTVRHPPGL